MQHSAGVPMIKPGEYMPLSARCRPADCPLLDAWFELNYRLQQEANDILINTAFVEEWIARLWAIVSPGPQCFWLFLARINEVALLCASRYVDFCEFSAADELLVKPRCALFHGKDRGPAVSQDTGARRRPLLPFLYDLLKGSGYMTEGYLLSVARRNEQIAQVMRMLLGLGMENAEQLSMKLSCMDVDQREDFRSRLCHFDRKTFDEIGRALHIFMQFWNSHDKCVSKYLRGC